jgi:acyl-CoA synthetase (AMP-forming)/AMP-acid ligase II
MPVFDVTVFLQTIERERISLVIGVPAILWLALQQPSFASVDTSSVRAVLYGAAPVSPTLVEQLCAAFPDARLGNGFGLTECTGLATMLPHELAAERADSVGLPAPVVDLDLLDPDPVTGVGELVIRGPNVCVGYWGKEEQTRSTFVDGWLRTGDLARIDDEGLVYIADRKKDMINRGGENVYSVQVENVLAAHPQVGEVAVVGVPDQMMGEKVGAVVVPRAGATIDVTELLDFAATQLADFQVPQYVVVSSEPLPRNPSGKVVKPLLRETVEWIPVPTGRRSGVPAIGEPALPVA